MTISWQGWLCPPLTTYAVDVDHMAKVSAQQLIRRIQKPDADVRRIVVSGKLVIRESVKRSALEFFQKTEHSCGCMDGNVCAAYFLAKNLAVPRDIAVLHNKNLILFV